MAEIFRKPAPTAAHPALLASAALLQVLLSEPLIGSLVSSFPWFCSLVLGTDEEMVGNPLGMGFVSQKYRLKPKRPVDSELVVVKVLEPGLILGRLPS